VPRAPSPPVRAAIICAVCLTGRCRAAALRPEAVGARDGRGWGAGEGAAGGHAARGRLSAVSAAAAAAAAPTTSAAPPPAARPQAAPPPPRLAEVLPKAGLLVSERGGLAPALCKPRVLPIKSLTLQKLEEMEVREGGGGEWERQGAAVRPGPLHRRAQSELDPAPQAWRRPLAPRPPRPLRPRCRPAGKGRTRGAAAAAAGNRGAASGALKRSPSTGLNAP
jgi:hypothetical protein